MEIYSLDYFIYLAWQSNPLSVIDMLTIDGFKTLIQNEPLDIASLWAMRQALDMFEDEELYEWCAVVRDEIRFRENLTEI